jgi:hypothetical protein
MGYSVAGLEYTLETVGVECNSHASCLPLLGIRVFGESDFFESRRAGGKSRQVDGYS